MSNDWKSDLAELFTERRKSRGTFYATRRFVVDLLSLAMPRPQFGHALQDTRHAFRLFKKHAGIVSITVAGLGLAIAMCTTVFSILNASLLRPYDMDDPATVVKIGRLYERGNSSSWPYSAFVELQRAATLSSVQASIKDSIRLESQEEASGEKPLEITFVSGGYLPMLGGRAAVGRTLDTSDDRPGAEPVVVLSHTFWKQRFNSDPSIVGRKIRLGTGVATVAGVVRPKFTGPDDQPGVFWAPFATYGALYGGAAIGQTSRVEVRVIARMPAGASASAAADELTSLARSLPPIGFAGLSAAPEKTTGVQIERASRIDGPDAMGVYIVLAVLLVVLGLVLALACANVANLLLAGASSRAREFGVRIAMGASQNRLMRQLLSESLAIGASAGAVGLLLSMWTVPLITRLVGLPMSSDVTMDRSVLLFTTLIAVLSGLGAGLAPARYGSRSDVAGILKAQSLQAGASPKTTRLRRGFIAFQAAASMLLLLTAALFLRSALHITQVELGFDADRLVAVNVDFPAVGATGADARIAAYFRTAVERVSAVPSVEGVALALSPPFGPAAVTTLQRNGAEYAIVNNRTDAGYFKTAGFRIARGRGYTPEEVAGTAPVALVSESLVRDFYQGVEPIGASLEPVMVRGGKEITIIGVVADALVTFRGGAGTTYQPIGPDPYATPQMIVRSHEPDRVIRDVEAALASIDPSVRLSSTVMRDSVTKFMSEPKILAGLSGAVALLALVLSVLGIFGVTSFVVGQRTQEVSVRMAIGASAGDVVRMLIRQNILPVAIGLLAGLGVALVAVRLLAGGLSGVSPYDPIAITAAVVVLAGTALAAVAIPAMRAAKTDPASVLRQS